jgi:RNA polymerase sigma-70 factor (ECF subfamily)
VSDRDEQQRVERARQGDRQAFAALVERYWQRVYRWLHGLTLRPHLAEDLTQETFLRAWSALATLRQEGGFLSWLFRIARNCLADSRRDPRAAARPLPESLPARDPDPLATVVDREGQALLWEACARLPVAYRAALLLWTQEELAYADIAQVLGITEATARWRVCRARQLLLRRLGTYLNREIP